MKKLNLLFLLTSLLALNTFSQKLQVSQNKRYLETTDGKPFLWIGDTAWELFHRLNREEAVEYLKQKSVDLVMLDMIMNPGINGRETFERILKIHPYQKVVLVSGFVETDEVKTAQKLGAGQLIKKPFTLKSIGIAIKEELKKP